MGHETWKPTCQLRNLTRLNSNGVAIDSQILQQKWVCIETDETKWKDIEVVFEEVKE